MTVAEQIKLLQALPPDARVLIDGYEGGLQDPEPPKLQEVFLDVRKQGYQGPHEYAEHYVPIFDDPLPAKITAVVIAR